MRFQGYSLPHTSLGALRFTHMYMLRRAVKDSRQLKREQATAERGGLDSSTGRGSGLVHWFLIKLFTVWEMWVIAFSHQ